MTTNYYRCKLVKEREVEYASSSTIPEVAEMFRAEIGDDADEVIMIACRNTSGQIVGLHEVGHGTIYECTFSVREIFKRALLNNAVAIFMAHNNPGGRNVPSTSDDKATKDVKRAGKVIGVELLDHIILYPGGYYSYREMQRL